jgi:hypothetical protein
MSFKAVWGFDPDEVLQAQQYGLNLNHRETPEGIGPAEELVKTPVGPDAQVSELRRIFRLYRL